MTPNSLKRSRAPQGIGQRRMQLWQCPCLRWNPNRDGHCGACKQRRPEEAHVRQG